MAEYKVTMPDGGVYKVTAPEGTPESVLIDQVRASQQPPRNVGTGIGAIDIPVSAFNETLIGVGSGLYNMGAAITDPLAEYAMNLYEPGYGTRSMQAEQERRRAFTESMSRTFSPVESPTARTTGEIAASMTSGMLKAPSAVVNVAPRLVTGLERGFQGAIGANAVSPEESSLTRGENAALGATLNVVLPPAVRAVAESRFGQYVGEGFRRATAPFVGGLDELAARLGVTRRPTPVPTSVATEPVVPSITVPGGLSPEQQSAVQSVGDLGQQAQQRLRNFMRIGIDQPTTGMVTREPAVWKFERDTMGLSETGAPIRDAIIKVNEGINRAADDLISKVGVADDVERVGVQAAEALAQKEKEMQAVTGNLYREASRKHGDKSAGSIPNFLERLDSPDMMDNETFDTMRSSVMRRLQRFGMTGSSGLVRKDAILTVDQAESLRKFIGNLGNSADPAVRMMRKELINALDDDVVSAFGDDTFKAARDAAKQRFDEFKKTLAGRIGAGDIAAEQVTSRLMLPGTSLKDFRTLKATLTTGTPEQIARGKEAWSSIGAQALQNMFNNARIGENIISGSKLASEFGKNAPRFKELLTRQEFVTLNRIVKAARNAHTPVDFASVNTSNAASALANLFAKEAATRPERSAVKAMLVNLMAGFAGGPGASAAMAGVRETSAMAAERAATEAAARNAQLQVSMAANPQLVAETLQANALRQAEALAARNAPTPGMKAPGMAPGLLEIASTPSKETPPEDVLPEFSKEYWDALAARMTPQDWAALGATGPLTATVTDTGRR